MSVLDYIRQEEGTPGEGLTISHIAKNYKGPDRPDKKFDVWIRAIEGTRIFEWNNEASIKIDMPKPSSANSSRSRSRSPRLQGRPTTRNTGGTSIPSEVIEDIYGSVVFLYERFAILSSTKESMVFVEKELHKELITTVEGVLQTLVIYAPS